MTEEQIVAERVQARAMAEHAQNNLNRMLSGRSWFEGAVFMRTEEGGFYLRVFVSNTDTCKNDPDFPAEAFEGLSLILEVRVSAPTTDQPQ